MRPTSQCSQLALLLVVTTLACGNDPVPGADAAAGADARQAEAPVPGSGGVLTLSDEYCHAATLSWTAASDDVTPAGELSYRAFYSESAAMTTVAEVQANGIPVDAAAAGLTTLRLSGLSRDTTYFANVIVSDGDGRQSVYSPATLTTRSPFERVSDINAGSFSADPREMAVLKGTLYFQAMHPDTGRELWSYDGTNPPELIADIWPGDNGFSAYSSQPRGLTVFKNKLYFAADDGINGRRLWVYDGTANPTVGVNVVTIDTMLEPGGFTAYMGRLYFAASSADGMELWWLDDSGNTGHENIATGACPGLACSSFPTALTVYNGALYFGAYTDTVGDELYRKIGTGASTLAADLYPGSCGGVVPCDSHPQMLIVYDDKLYMQATGPGGGREMWVYDGSTASKAFDLNDAGQTSPQELVVFDSQLLFNGDGKQVGQQLWAYDGANPPEQITPGAAGASPHGMTVSADKLYFSSSATWDGEFTGVELWLYDGSNPPELVCEMIPGSGGGNPANLIELGGALYFSAGGDDGAGNELWRLVKP